MQQNTILMHRLKTCQSNILLNIGTNIGTKVKTRIRGNKVKKKPRLNCKTIKR